MDKHEFLDDDASMQPPNSACSYSLGILPKAVLCISANWNTEEMVRRLEELACAIRRFVD
jgi:hypothetical protein